MMMKKYWKNIGILMLLALVISGCTNEEVTPVETVVELAIESTEESAKSEDTEVAQEEAVESEETINEEIEDETGVIALNDIPMGELANQKGINIGAAIEPYQLDDPLFARRLAEEFNQITPENALKWRIIQPEQGVFNFEGADKIVAFAKENNMKVKGHTFAWHNSQPSWLADGEFTKEELLDVLETHIKTVVGHYKGDVYAWDVCNEIIDLKSYRENKYYQVIGPEYIEKSLIWAREADPDALLYINDYLNEEINNKSTALYDLCVELLDKGVPLDGVGMQFHMSESYPLDLMSVYANVKRFTDLGLLVDFTEVDVRIYDKVTEAKLEHQGEIYADLLELVLAMDGVNTYTTWGLTDNHSWIPDYFGNASAGLIFDEVYQPKPAYRAMIESLTKEKIELDYEFRYEELVKDRVMLDPIIAKKMAIAPVIDGEFSEGEWDNTINYSFVYNQLDQKNQTFDFEDIYGEWRVAYKDNMLYGRITRRDDVTKVHNPTDYINDCLEVFLEHGSEFNQYRTIVGSDWQIHKDYKYNRAVWNKDRTQLEFNIMIPEEDLTGFMMGFNIALTDVDREEEVRDGQFYPITGNNNSYKGEDLINILFEGDSARPVDVVRICPAYKVDQATTIPTLDGQISSGEWDQANKYYLGFNQLSALDQSMENDDFNVEWAMVHDKGQLIGRMIFNDDALSASDAVSCWIETDEGYIGFSGSRGSDMTVENSDYPVDFAWNEESDVLEFSISLPDDIKTGTITTFNISASDDDGDGVESMMYPIPGSNKTREQGNKAELMFN